LHSEGQGFESPQLQFEAKNRPAGRYVLLSDHLNYQKHQAQPRLTGDRLITPLDRIIGGQDLWGRLDAFLYFSEAAEHTPATIKAYRTLVGDFIRFANSIGATMPGDVQEEHIVAYIIHKRKTCNGTSVSTYYHHVRAWFNWMARRGIVPVSPCAVLKNPTIPKTVIRPITGDDLVKILSCCTGYFRGIRDKAIVLLIYDSGLRRSEVSGIKLDDVDLGRGAIKVMGKGAKERYVAIGDEAKKAIMSYLLMRTDGLPWLFITQLKGSPDRLSPDGIYQVVKRLVQRAGITGVKMGPHTLRHSFATASIRNGAPLPHLQALLGHSTPTMSLHYAASIDSEDAVKNHHTFSPADRLRQRKAP